MAGAALEDRLQGEIEGVVGKNRDVFSAVLRVGSASGSFRWAGAAGAAYTDSTEPMQAGTPIYIASITKMYVAAATMILEERGLLSLDDPLSKFLPAAWLTGLHRYKGQDYSDQLRVYHLISQTSGLPDYFMDKPKHGTSVFDRIVSGGDMEWGVEEDLLPVPVWARRDAIQVAEAPLSVLGNAGADRAFRVHQCILAL